MAAPDGEAGRTDRGEGWWLAGLAAALLAAFPYAEQTRNANERPRLLQAAALVEAGTWAIDGPVRRGIDPGPDVSRDPRSGATYPNKPPGATIAAAAGVVAAGIGTDAVTLRGATWWGRLFAGVLPTLALALWLRRRLVPGAAGTLAVGLWVLATPAVVYAHLLYGHALAACVLWIGVVLVVDGVREDRRWAAGIGGALAACSVTVEYSAAFAGLPLAVFVLAWLGARWQAGVCAAIGAAGPLALLAGYHAAVFGGPLRTGYHHVVDAGFAAKHGEGLLGLVAPSWRAFHAHVLSSETGLLWWAPLAVVGAAGLVDLALGTASRTRSQARVHLAAFVVMIAVCASLNFEGGWRVGPRYLVAVLPALVLGWSHALRWIAGPGRPAWRALTLAALIAWSATIDGLAANLWPHFDPTNVDQPVSEVLLPLWRAGRSPYMAAPIGVTVVVAGSVIGLLVLLGRMATRGQQIAAVVGAAIGVAMVAATTCIPGHPRGAANLAYIERVWEPPGASQRLLP